MREGVYIEPSSKAILQIEILLHFCDWAFIMEIMLRTLEITLQCVPWRRSSVGLSVWPTLDVRQSPPPLKHLGCFEECVGLWFSLLHSPPSQIFC